VGTEDEHASLEVKKALVERACKDAYADEFIRNLPEVRADFVSSSTGVLITSRVTTRPSVRWVSNSAAASGRGLR
jgi:hypothetical protein